MSGKKMAADELICLYKQGDRKFTNLDLSSTDLSGKDLLGINLSNSALANTDLFKTNLRETKLALVGMRCANLEISTYSW